MDISSLSDLLHRADVVQKLVASGSLVVAVVGIHYLSNRGIRRLPSRDSQRYLMVQVRNFLGLLLCFGLAAIWATQLRTMALSIVAVAAAVAIATRDVIACMGGTLVKTLSQAFSIGDRIEIDGIRGDVIDQTLFTTTVMEIGPGHLTHGYTGRAISIPNALFLTKHLVNESYTDHYVLHVFTVPLKGQADWKKAEGLLGEAAREVCAPFADLAKLHFEQLGRRRGLVTPATEPRITLTMNQPGVIEMIVRICVPARQKGKAEQAILRKFLEQFPVGV